MTFTSPLKLKLAALLAVLSVGLVAAMPADAIVAPRKCGTVKAKEQEDLSLLRHVSLFQAADVLHLQAAVGSGLDVAR